MAKVPINSFVILGRRSYAVVAENVRVQYSATNSVMRKAAESGGSTVTTEGAPEKQKEIFWMKDPKTGNWIPENHFGGIDVAELRNKVLSKKDKL
ncbi:hypothetical protein L1049_005487 [Liquidambar formosana]|uniref:Late embryogenesis abundant protein n=1 Tax=Liquidambar formosana TaxID=63359 RepID=A0AAP0WZ97_LIQFO